MNRLLAGRITLNRGAKPCRRLFASKTVTLEDVRNEAVSCLKTRGWTKPKVLVEHLQKSLGISSFKEWGALNGSSGGELNLRKTLTSWGFKYTLEHGRFTRLRYEGAIATSSTKKMEKLRRFLEEQNAEGKSRWVTRETVQKSLGLDFRTLADSKGEKLVDKLKTHGIRVIQAKNGGVVKLQVEKVDVKKVADFATKMLDHSNWMPIERLEEKLMEEKLLPKEGFAAMGAPIVVKKRLTPFNIAFYLSGGKLKKVKLKESSTGQKKEKTGAKAFHLAEVRECLLSYLEDRPQWVRLEEVNSHLTLHNYPRVETLGRNRESTLSILDQWGVMAEFRDDKSIKRIRVGFRFEETELEKHEPLSPEQMQVEDNLRVEFSKMARNPDMLYIMGLHATDHVGGALLLTAETEKLITSRNKELAGSLLLSMNQMPMLTHFQQDGKHYVSVRNEDPCRNFVLRKAMVGLIFGPKGSTIKFIQQHCNNTIVSWTHEQSDHVLFHITGSLMERAEALTLLCRAPLKHPHFDSLTSQDVLSWMALCIDTLSFLIQLETWTKIERLRNVILQILHHGELPLDSLRDSQIMLRLQSAYLDPKMNKEWLAADLLSLCKYSSSVSFISQSLDILKDRSESLETIQAVLNSQEYWNGMSLPSDFETLLDALHEQQVLGKVALHNILEAHGVEKTDLEFGFRILNWMNGKNYDVDLETLCIFMRIVEKRNDASVAKWFFDKLTSTLPDFASSIRLLEPLLKVYTRCHRYTWISQLLETHRLQFRNSSAILFLLLVHLEKQVDYPIPTGLQDQVKTLLTDSLCQPKNRAAAKLLVENVIHSKDNVEIDLITEVLQNPSIPTFLSKKITIVDQ